jgi:hypothetical protein
LNQAAGAEGAHGRSTEQFPVSAFVGSSENLKDLKAPGVAGPEPGEEGGWEEDGCVICWEGARTHVVVPCGHVVLCGVCAPRIGASIACCPVLTPPITHPYKAHCMPDAGPDTGPASVTGKIR